MKFHYYPETDSLYIGLIDKPSTDSQEVPTGVVLDFDRRGHLVGIDIDRAFRPDSDIDILVEFEPRHTPGFAFIDIQDKLSKIFGRTVDLNTPQDLSRYFRDRVLTEAEVYYEQPR